MDKELSDLMEALENFRYTTAVLTDAMMKAVKKLGELHEAYSD